MIVRANFNKTILKKMNPSFLFTCMNKLRIKNLKKKIKNYNQINILFLLNILKKICILS